ncbi:hypothetical protein CGRA01v4_04559 [Colletotrichum graminicola]|nr:hypothetical protein CGRA01v4_04559 [Colletotrichum graminicola]
MVVARYQHRWLKDGFSARLEVRPYTELAYRKKPEISVARAVGQILQRFQRQNCRKLLVEMLDRLTPVENEEREKKRGLLRRPEDESCILKLISFAGGALGSSTGNALSARNQLLSVCISTEVGAAFSHLADRDN